MSGNGLQPKCSVLRIKRHILDIIGRGHAFSSLRSRPSVSGSGVQVRVQVSGRANHPWLAAAEQGCSALPKAERRTQRETGNREGCCGHHKCFPNRHPLTANRFYLTHSKLNSPSVASGGGGSPARMVRTKRSRCSAQGPCARRASTCSGVPYPLWVAKPYWG